MSIAALSANSAYTIRPMTTSRASACTARCGCENCSSTRATTSTSSDSSREDSVEISPEAKTRSEQEQAASVADESKAQSGKPTAQNGEPTAQSGKPLDETQQKEVTKLKDRDREVRQHEAAHLAAAGGHATGGPSFTYEKGPDGKQYAVGGEVNVDTSEEKTPEATLRKMQQIQRAALAPAEPSGQDHSVAAAASQKAAEARREIATKNVDPAQDKSRSTRDDEAGRGQRLNLVA